MTTGQKPEENENSDEVGLSPIPDFISGVLAKARKAEGADGELLDILENRIVHADSATISSELAHSDIDALAEERAKCNQIDDESDKN